MRKEDELIICCARTVTPHLLTDRIRCLVNEKLNWKYIIQASQQHAVLPLVFQNLHTVCPNSLSDTILQEMKNSCRSTVAHNLYMASMLLKVLTLFKKQGIKAVPFKGPVLAENVYGNLGLRNFGDLDILIWPHDAGTAIDLLRSQGFKALIPLSSAQLTAYMKTEDDMVLTLQDKGLVVELHWEMTGRILSRPMDMDFINKRLETVSLLDRDVEHLSAEDLLLYLCIHGTRHMWERLDWICCVGELIRSRQDLHWDMAFKLARTIKCHRILQHGLLLTHILLETKLPKNVLDKLTADRELQKLALEIKNQILPLYEPLQSTGGGNRFKLLQYRVRDSLSDRVVYGWRQLTAPREADWRWLPMPAQLTFLYLFLRPLRLCLKQLRPKGALRNSNFSR